MIQSVGLQSLDRVSKPKMRRNSGVQTPINSGDKVVNFKGNNVSAFNKNMLQAYQAYGGVDFANSISFTGSMGDVFRNLRQQITTCRDLEHGKKGEGVGSMINVSELVDKMGDDLVYYDDAMKITVPIAVQSIDKERDHAVILPARAQLKKMAGGDILYEMVVRDPVNVCYSDYLKTNIIPSPRIKVPNQKIKIQLTPDKTDTEKSSTKEKTYVLETKGKLMAVIEDGDNVILTNGGSLHKKNAAEGTLIIQEYNPKSDDFEAFDVKPVKVRERKPMPSIGEGTDIVIGMEDGRFVGELIKSIENFQKKVESGEVPLDQFVAAEGAEKVQLAMLAGGFGSRAEYANASSDGIFHGVENGAQSTKGVFETATGLTPMETTFITLHKAGLLDCSNLKVGKNIKFYLNKSGVNKGNGGFTVDLYNKMEREGRESLFILPNDSMSRMTNAVSGAVELMNSGKSAVAMISKTVPSEEAAGALGIMKIGEDKEILEFAEKPKVIPEGYEADGKCLTNTFQFAVSKDAFKALAEIEPHLYAGKGKETRDWSKLYIPILMSLTQEEDSEAIQNAIFDLTAEKNKETGALEGKYVPLNVIENAQDILKGKKVYSVPTSESWADCGTLSALYKTTIDIAKGDFELEDFERAHVLKCVNTHTGLVASSPEQKDELYFKYWIDGPIMAVKQAKPVDTEAYLEKYKDAITVNERATT